MNRHHMTAAGPVPFTEEEEAQADADAKAFLDGIPARNLEAVRQARFAAYQAESDPLFFKVQRGEATMQDWMSKVAEIKARFPDPQP